MNKFNEINIALKEFSLGNKSSAYAKLKKIFKNNEEDAQLRFNLAVIQEDLNFYDEAKINYLYLIDKNNNYKAMINLYLLYIKEENFEKALPIIERVINLNINFENVKKDKAFVLYKLKQFDKSINICEKNLKIKKDIYFLNILGLNFLSKKEYAKSEKVLIDALEINKQDHFILNSLGRLYHERRDSKNAEKYYVLAYNLRSDSYEIINNLAGFYREDGKYEKSLKLYLKALEINPNNSKILNNLANVYFDIGKLDMAEKYCIKALKLNENDGNIQKILSQIYLCNQKYKIAWPYFDGRLKLTDFVEKNSSINIVRTKLFNKKEIDKKMKILVIREQGVGDEILYGTMYQDLFTKCDNVTIECDKRLKNIFQYSFPKFHNSFVDFGEISNDIKLIKNFDYTIYAGSLGKFFRNKIEDFYDGVYLKINESLIHKSKLELSNYSGKLNIGISWKSFKNRYSNEKSLLLEDLKNIFQNKNCNFINLQYGDVEEEIKDYNYKNNANILTLKNLDLFNDFIGLGAVLKNLDLFITVSNSTAHLAGALGVKTLLVRPENHAIFHYWNQPSSYTPWYDSVTLLDKSYIKNDKNLVNKFLSI